MLRELLIVLLSCMETFGRLNQFIRRPQKSSWLDGDNKKSASLEKEGRLQSW